MEDCWTTNFNGHLLSPQRFKPKKQIVYPKAHGLRLNTSLVVVEVMDLGGVDFYVSSKINFFMVISDRREGVNRRKGTRGALSTGYMRPICNYLVKTK